MKKRKKGIVNFQRAICIRIKNLTDKTLSDVKVFDFEHEKQQYVQYLSGIPTVTYNHILRRLASFSEPSSIIGCMRNIVTCDCEDTLLKQVECDIDLIIKTIHGKTITDKTKFKMNDVQQKRNACDLDVEHPFYVDSNIIIKELLPKTKVLLTLWMKNTPKRKKNIFARIWNKIFKIKK